MPFRVFDHDVFIYKSRLSDTALKGLDPRRKIPENAAPYMSGACMCKEIRDKKNAMPCSTFIKLDQAQ